MKITHNKVGQNLNLTDSGKVDKASDKNKIAEVKSQQTSAINSEGTESAKLDLSSRAQDLKKIKELALSSPDMDQAKVDKFQKLIDSGKYKVDAKAIADRLVDENLFNSNQTSND